MAGTNKLALLVGCNYFIKTKTGENSLLHGCINDVKAMQALIGRFGFQDQNITILTDDQVPERRPTFANIIEALTRMITAAKAEDTLLFYFSGGGALVNRPDNPLVTNEIKKDISAIIPCDFMPITAGCILPIINQLPDKAIFTFICDSSYSGGLFDGLFDDKVHTESNVHHRGSIFGLKTIPSHFVQPNNACPALPPDILLKDKILISSTKANEESVEVYPNRDELKAFSAFSNAIQTLLNSPEAVNPTVAGNDLEEVNTNREVAKFTKGLLSFIGFDQHPYLKCSEKEAAAPFLGGTVA